ncbi:transposase [Variovorax guangxiensis]|uniref:Transposase n=1 Tax=Variovorax guangxiensis TaxID=1775474 RepID=A0A502DSY2_9BURK|nr:transposase [Variovorax guangxiensis]RZI63773.1 MAG: transposase [Variovorax sp.]TPG24233.1 transposase [Variovorax ginsengisoli]TPG28483.1 transposase [Variovorax guangxiensis]
MARLPRLSLPGLPHHVIQRGNNRQAIVADTGDRERLLSLWADQAPRFGVALHAYMLMDNHFHLLVTPTTADGLPQFMQAVGRSYVRGFNDRHGRSGTLWEGRYRATVLHAERYLLPCMVYMDLNPVRAGLVVEAREHAWSSHQHYAGLRTDRFVSPHPLYWTLGNTPFAREAAYTDLVRQGIPTRDQLLLTEATLQGWAVGDPAFVAALQQATPRRLVKARAGRRPTLQTSER